MFFAMTRSFRRDPHPTFRGVRETSSSIPTRPHPRPTSCAENPPVAKAPAPDEPEIHYLFSRRVTQGESVRVHEGERRAVGREIRFCRVAGPVVVGLRGGHQIETLGPSHRAGHPSKKAGPTAEVW